MPRRARRLAIVSALALASAAGAARAQQMKISQVFGGGGNTGAPFNRDFVELFNAGATPVDLTGWSVQYAAAAGTTWQKTDLIGGIVPPGGYYLIQMTLTGTNGAALPAPDHVVGTAIAMSATAGKVALVNGTTALTGACPTGAQIIDFVGFGTTANCFEGSGPTAAPSNATAVLRNDDGCQDSGGTVGDNAANFTVGVPVPLNSQAPANPCPLPPGADLGVTVSDSVSQVSLGAASVFVVTVNNFGPDLTPSSTVTVNLPANAEFQGSTPPAVPVDGVLTFVTGPIASAGSEQISIALRNTSGRDVPVTASVTGPLDDSTLANNSAGDTTLIYDRQRARVVMGADAAVPVVAVDVLSGAQEPLFTDNVRALASDDAERVLYYSKGTQLWKVSYDNLGNPELVGAFNGAVTTISGGLAFDSSRRELIASTTSSFYSVDPATARTVLRRAVGAGDFGGIDYDPVADRVVAANDSTATTNGLSGRGLYRVDVNGSDLTFIDLYPVKTAPSTLDTDIDALAYGGGFIYPISDEDRWFYRYDQSAAAYQEPSLTGFGADRTQGGATFTAELFNQSPGANLSVKASGPAPCQTPLGQEFTVTLTTTNLGPSAAASPTITVFLPTNAQFVSSVPAATPVNNQLVFTPPDLADDATFEVSVVLIPTSSAGNIPVAIAAASGTADAFPSNNFLQRDFRAPALPPTTFTSEAVFSTFPGSNSTGLPGLSFSDALDLGRPYASRNGLNWIILADTDNPDTNADQVLVRGSGTGFGVVAQEGTTVLGVTPIRTLDGVYGVNDAGDFTFGTDLDGTTTAAGETIAKSVGGVFSVVATQGDAVLAIQDALLGGTSNSARITNGGAVSFYSTLTGTLATADSALFTADGTAVVAQEGVSAPLGQVNADVYNEFSSGATLGQGFFMDSTGVAYCVRATLEGATANDTVIVVNGNVVLQEGVVVPNSTFGSPITALNMNHMEAWPVWTAYGSNADGQDWAVVNGAVVAATDQEIVPGSGELWDDTSFAQTFFFNVANSRGQYVVGGLTNAADPNANAVLVLNGRRVVLRENDPIDLNRNGVFDDDAYVHIFRDDFGFISGDGWLYLAVRTRNGSSDCLGTAPTESGQAFIRVRLSCPVDFNGDATVDPDDLADYIGCYFSPPCDGADFNGDGNTDPDDLADYIAAYFSGGGC